MKWFYLPFIQLAFVPFSFPTLTCTAKFCDTLTFKEIIYICSEGFQFIFSGNCCKEIEAFDLKSDQCVYKWV